MLLQLINIVCGILLIRDKISHPSARGLLSHILPFEAKIGVAALVLGLLGLVERLNIVYFDFPLGSSFPQALPAIAAGLVLGAPYLKKLGINEQISILASFGMILGYICIASGLGSLLFGCISPIGCSAPF